MLNLKSRKGRGVSALAVALSMTVAGVGGLALDAGAAHAKKSKKTTSKQKASAKNKNSTKQNSEANGGECTSILSGNTILPIGGVAIALPANVLSIPIFSPAPVVAVAGAPVSAGNGNQTCHGGASGNTNTNNQGAVAANNGTTVTQ